MRILDALGSATSVLTVREIAAQLKLPRPTVYRLLQTLIPGGIVMVTGNGFAIGQKVLALAAQRLGQIEIRSLGKPLLAELSLHCRETVHMGLLEQGRVVYIDKIDSPGPLRMASAVGKIVPAHSTALGKVMLAYLPPEAAQTILQVHGMPRLTANTIVQPDQFFRERELIRTRGYSIDNAENEEGVRCVAGAIFNHSAEIAGAVSVSGSVHTVTLERARRTLGPEVRDVAKKISAALGWTGKSASIVSRIRSAT